MPSKTLWELLKTLTLKPAEHLLDGLPAGGNHPTLGVAHAELRSFPCAGSGFIGFGDLGI